MDARHLHRTGMDRFKMATTLVARARAHQLWIGDDHGDRYELAMAAQSVPDEMQIIVKELLEHLRAALDYAAQQVWQDLVAAPSGARVYFPIASESAKEIDFVSLMNRKMPGVAAAFPQALTLFKSFQVFSDPANNWLPDLATLVNQTKHDHLEVASVPESILTFTRDADGMVRTKFAPGHGPKRGTPWMKVKGNMWGGKTSGSYEAYYLQFPAIRMELSTFLKESIPGVERIVNECRTLVTRS